MTRFEQHLKDFREGKLNPPSVSMGNKQIDPFAYSLAVHISNLKIMRSGMKFRNIKFTDIKKYYGLKGRSAKDCVPELEKIYADYKADLNKPSIEEVLS
jgi:hypothetical protein